MKSALRSFILLSAAMGLAGAQAKTLPSPDIPGGQGVNIHFTDPRPGEMKMLAAGGFGWVRMDFGWAGTERVKGEYDFSAYDRLMASLEPNHIHPIFILDYSNKFYDNGESPHSDEAIQAFAQWAAAAAKHFQGRGILWEMYNEPNISFWRPKPDVQQYIRLGLAVGKALRQAAPNETYIGPGVSTMDFTFLEACFRSGLLDYWDAVSVHPYRGSAPETAGADFRKLRLMIHQYGPAGKAIPIISSEWGYSSHQGGISEETQGKMLPRQWLSNLANGVVLSIWYDWHEDGPDLKENEHHFGTVRYPYHPDRDPVYDPKPAYTAAKTLTAFLDGYRFNKRLALASSEDYVLLFSHSDPLTQTTTVRLAAWTTSTKPHHVTIPASAGTFQHLSHIGEPLPPLTADHSGLTLELTDAPQYLAPPKTNDLLQVAAAWRPVPLEIVAHAPAQVSIESYLKNTIDRPLDARLTSDNSVNRSVHVSTGPVGALGFRMTYSVLRTPEPVPVRLDLHLANLGTISQETQIIVSNPLAVSLLPAAGGALPVQFRNPSGEAFHGKIRLVNTQGLGAIPHDNSVDLTEGETEKTLRFPIKETPVDYRAGLELRDDKGRLVLDMPARRFHLVDDFSRYTAGQPPAGYTLMTDGDPKVVSTQSVIAQAPPQGPPAPGMGCLKITYDFAAGWKFIRLVPPAAVKVMEGRPQSFGLWVYGDGEGNAERLRFADAAGATYQPDAPNIAWHGWKFITFTLTGPPYHWGGPGDNTIHYPIRWDSLFLLDSAGQHATHGTVYISGPTLTMNDKDSR